MNELTMTIAQLLQTAGVPDFQALSQRIVQGSLASADPATVAHLAATRICQGEPAAYVLGYQVFMGIGLIAAPGALVPRDETEIVGQAAVAALRDCGSASPVAIDMCCGSGNLACALAHHVPSAQVWASDLTDGCIALTRRNVAQLELASRVSVFQGDLFAPLGDKGLEGMVDVVVCNPPYISQGKLAGDSAPLLQHEPREAFDGGPYGLSIHQRVIRESQPFLKPGGTLLFEIGAGQDSQVKRLFERSGGFEKLQVYRDAGGLIRSLSARKITN